MTWLYVPSLSAQGLEGLTSASGLPDPTTVLWVLLNDKPTARQYSSRECRSKSWIMLLSGTTLEPSTADAGVEALISLRRVIHVNLSQNPGSDSEPQTSVGSGVRCGASFAKWDHGSSSWRTFQVTLAGHLDEFSATWPRAGGVLNGTAFLRQPSAPLTSAIGSSYSPDRRRYPTPTAREIKGPTGDSFQQGLTSALGITTRKVLNPEFVEWMMGLPIGWSAIGPSVSMRLETALSQLRRLERGGYSRSG